jgi:hypothetical protein
MYKEEVVKKYGEGFNYEEEPIDSWVVYDSGGGKAHGRWDQCIVLFNFVNARYGTSYYCWLLFLRFALFDGVLGSREAMPLRRSSSSTSSGLTPCVSHINLNYESMENQLRTTLEMLAVKQEEHRETRELVNAFNS